MADEELTRGQRAARTRAANKAKKATEATATVTDSRLRASDVLDAINAGNDIVRTADGYGVTLQSLTFVHKGVTVTADGDDWILS